MYEESVGFAMTCVWNCVEARGWGRLRSSYNVVFNRTDYDLLLNLITARLNRTTEVSIA